MHALLPLSPPHPLPLSLSRTLAVPYWRFVGAATHTHTHRNRERERVRTRLTGPLELQSTAAWNMGEEQLNQKEPRLLITKAQARLPPYTHCNTHSYTHVEIHRYAWDTRGTQRGTHARQHVCHLVVAFMWTGTKTRESCQVLNAGGDTGDPEERKQEEEGLWVLDI